MGKDLKGKELGVGISQRPDGRYTARFTDRRGKRRQQYFQRLQECRNWLADAQFADEHGDIFAGESMTVDAWFEYWIDEIKSGSIKARTMQNYLDRFSRNIKPCIGDMLLADVKPLHCQNALNLMAKDGYCASTVNLTRITMQTLFASAVENGLLPKNPTPKKSDCKGTEPKPERVLTVEEQRAFLTAAKGRSGYYNQYALILQTGLRIGELAGLRWPDVDFGNRVLHVRHTAESRSGTWDVRAPKSKAGNRDVPLNDEAIRILQCQRLKMRLITVVQMEYADTVFLSSGGRPIRNSEYNRGIKQICARFGIEHFSTHTLRHTFATRCAEAGMPPKVLQVVMGHSSISVTMDIYVHCTDNARQDEMQKIAGSLKVV